MRTVLTSKNIGLMKAKISKEEGEQIKPDNYLTKLIKYIPSEIVALYITLLGIATTAKTEIAFELITWLIFLIGIIGTLLYLWRIEKVTNWLQLSISTIAFVIWAFALGGPFANLSWYHPVYGALILPVYTFFIPIVVGK